MIEGSCLFGAVRYELDESRILLLDDCHCTDCRKSSDAAYATSVQVPAEHFRWLAGRELTVAYDPPTGSRRVFCEVCGSSPPRDDEDPVAVPAGSLDGDPRARPAIHMFTASRAPWHAVRDSLPSIPDGGTDAFWEAFLAELEERERT